MLNFSNDQAIQRAYHLKQHKIKLREIQTKSKSIDNTLSPLCYPLPRQTGYKAIYWTEKVSRDNKLLLSRLVKIKQKPSNIPVGQLNPKLHPSETQKISKKPFNPTTISPSLSTKNILKDYTKYKNYLDLRAKLFQQRISTEKKLKKTLIPHFLHKSKKLVKLESFSSP